MSLLIQGTVVPQNTAGGVAMTFADNKNTDRVPETGITSFRCSSGTARCRSSFNVPARGSTRSPADTRRRPRRKAG